MDTVITSAHNGTIKYIRKLMTSGKARREENTYVAEGAHLVRSFLATEQAPLLYAYAESALKNPEVADLVRELEGTTAQRVIIADSLFESATHLHAAVGILIAFSPSIPSKEAVLPFADSAIMLEDVQDPGNLGTILRTTAAVGIKDAILSPGCASPWSPKALRAGMGAQFSLRIHEAAILTEVIEAATVPVLATSLAPDSQPLFALDLRQPVVWLFGNEGQGVSEPLASRASMRVLIPQAATSVESLNVAAAAAVCLYEQFRQKKV